MTIRNIHNTGADSVYELARNFYTKTGEPVSNEELRGRNEEFEKSGSAIIKHTKALVGSGRLVKMKKFESTKSQTHAPVLVNGPVPRIFNAMWAFQDFKKFLSERREHVLFVCNSCGNSFRVKPIIPHKLRMGRPCDKCGGWAKPAYYKVFKTEN